MRAVTGRQGDGGVTCLVVCELEEGQMAKTNHRRTLKEMPNSTTNRDGGGAYSVDTV